MPSGISLSHESFATELLRHFDKRRSQLHEELILNEDNNMDTNLYSMHSHHHTSSQHSHSLQQVTSNSSSSHESSIENGAAQDLYIEQQEKQRSAGDLIRKSSSYIRSRFIEGSKSTEAQLEQSRASMFNSWSLKRKKKNSRSDRDYIYRDSNSSLPTPSYQLSKVAIRTTIIIPSYNYADNTNTHYTTTTVQPPVITHYPPKPLKYSPIEPLPEYTGTTKKLLHRLSMPLLKLTTHNNENTRHVIERRRSDSDVLNRQNNGNQKTLFENMTRTWNRLLYTCKLKKR
ncbi:hypothetical protein BDB01DRAFT_848727 [Pilobolus umbonatus]|nr:hypothetical protein BDB01DRAFT_848727 [Pilobolus umbonatus]